MNTTPSANRLHIAFFGKRNTGKSSLVNAVTGQNLAIVSEQKGTTTDPVFKSMELLPLGPVVIIDTPGIDDEGMLGELRVEKAQQVLNKTDIAVLVVENINSQTSRGGRLPVGRRAEEELINLFKDKNIPYIVAFNKSDLTTCNDPGALESWQEKFGEIIPVSAKTGHNIQQLKEKIAALANTEEIPLQIVGDLIKAGDIVILVTPIDEAAPKGRLILPQQQTIRDILDTNAIVVVVKETQYRDTLTNLKKKPALVISDSQVFDKVSAETPDDIYLTSFSILFARLKGFLDTAVKSIKAIDSIENGDKILICEGCTHHRQCDDIGTVKLPRWIKEYTGKSPEFVFCSGGDFPKDLSPYKLILHCGACMLNNREIKYRRDSAAAQGIPFTNYGISIAHIKGILNRSIKVFGQ